MKIVSGRMMLGAAISLLALMVLLASSPIPGHAERPDGGPLPEIEQGPDEDGPSPDEMRRFIKERRQQRRDGRFEGPGGKGDGRAEGGGGRRFEKLGRMHQALGFIESMSNTVKEPSNALGLAVIGIRDHYKKTGKPLEAVPVLEETLASAKDRQARNILLFALRQVYEEANNQEKLLSINKQILKENVDALNK